MREQPDDEVEGDAERGPNAASSGTSAARRTSSGSPHRAQLELELELEIDDLADPFTSGEEVVDEQDPTSTAHPAYRPLPQ